MPEPLTSIDVVVNNVEKKEDDKPFTNPITVYNSMLASADSLYDETAVTAPSTPSGSGLLLPDESTAQKTKEISATRKNFVSISSNEESVPSLRNGEEDSEEYMTPASDEERKPESDINRKNEVSVEYVSNQAYCLQTVINSGYISLDRIIEKVKLDIENGVYDCRESSFNMFLKEDRRFMNRGKSTSCALTEQSSQPMLQSSNGSQLSLADNSQQFYSTTSTPIMVRVPKRKSALASAMKKKNCIIL
ncbi:hypothetical protein G6F56_011573 [Rhizopus delemar]|uniref:Uncharacterized protein n=1 Tax=Rhizopus stolonifer TaxID=4846 RepID=A0A367KXB9_RHIST|nr:hypothetical protein G6F56_011573 [Rhizopus delemar]RCI06859.1 hypothetical protein CU098_012628 [Rhizopus stolonifer]